MPHSSAIIRLNIIRVLFRLIGGDLLVSLDKIRSERVRDDECSLPGRRKCKL